MTGVRSNTATTILKSETRLLAILIDCLLEKRYVTKRKKRYTAGVSFKGLPLPELVC